MALDDVRHVEAVALIKALVEERGSILVGAAALAWCEENHPPPSAYMAAMTHMAKGGRMDETCTCGHAPEEHTQSIGLGACEADGCECIQYEAEDEGDA
jgi:hypothetical protein